MTEKSKAVMATVVIVACLALLGVMIHLKVDGAAVGALAIVTTLVAWITRAPSSTPPGATAIPFIAAGALLVSLVACGCSPAQKVAEQDLITRNSPCLLQCAVTKAFANESPAQVGEECGVQCGGKAITDPQTLTDIAHILEGTHAGARQAGMMPPDAGK